MFQSHQGIRPLPAFERTIAMHRTAEIALLLALALAASAYWLYFQLARRFAIPSHI